MTKISYYNYHNIVRTLLTTKLNKCTIFHYLFDEMCGTYKIDNHDPRNEPTKNNYKLLHDIIVK